MEELQRKKASRKAYRSHLTHFLRKVDAILDSETRPTKTQIATLTSSTEQLTKLGKLLCKLDGEIATTIQTKNELEAEIIEAEATQESIRDKISQIRQMIDMHTSPVSLPPSVSATEFVPSDRASEPPTRRELPVSRLPKLNLPSFAGAPFTWQSFWDQPIPSKLTATWHSVVTNLAQTPNLSIPRRYLQFKTEQPLTLHVFVDASMKAYGITIYICQGMQSSFVMAKA